MPAIRRVTKQIIYAAVGFFVLASALSFFILPPLLDLLRRDPTDTPAPPDAVAVETVDSVVHTDSVDIVARVRNPNPRAGVPNYSVVFVLLDADGNEIDRIQQETYLLPGSLNYIAALDIPLTTALARVQVETPEQTFFAELPSGIAAPTFNSFLRERRLRNIGNFTVEEQKGVVTNTSTLAYRQVDITAVAFDGGGAVVGISTTFVGELAVGEQREVTLQWPAPSNPTTRVIMLPSTNIYEPDNILDPRGDPSLLRDEFDPAPEQVQGTTQAETEN